MILKKKEHNKTLMSSINEAKLGQIVSFLIGCAQSRWRHTNIRKIYREQKVSESIWNIVCIGVVHIGYYPHCHLGQ